LFPVEKEKEAGIQRSRTVQEDVSPTGGTSRRVSNLTGALYGHAKTYQLGKNKPKERRRESRTNRLSLALKRGGSECIALSKGKNAPLLPRRKSQRVIPTRSQRKSSATGKEARHYDVGITLIYAVDN